MRDKVPTLTSICSALLLLGCSASKGAGDGADGFTGVWEGSYSGLAPTAGNAPKGPLCLSITQNGSQINGRAWVSGNLWDVSFSGSASGNVITGSASGQDLNGNNVTVDFNLNVSGSRITGTVRITVGSQSQTYNINLSKQANKTDCGWANRDLAFAFGQALGGAISGNPNSPNSLGFTLASFITQVPRVNVRLDGTDYYDWWVCIWEIRDKTTSQEFTVGGIIDTNVFSRMAGWYVTNSTPNIGVSSSLSPQAVNASLNMSNNPAFLVYGTLIFAANGSNDMYFNNGTQVSGSPFYISPCVSGIQYKVWMSTISSFYIKFDGLGNDLVTHTFESPSGASPSNTNNNVPALYIEIDSCTP